MKQLIQSFKTRELRLFQGKFAKQPLLSSYLRDCITTFQGNFLSKEKTTCASFRGNFSLCETAFASFEVPAPVCGRNGAFIQTTVSLVSADTKRLYEK